MGFFSLYTIAVEKYNSSSFASPNGLEENADCSYSVDRKREIFLHKSIYDTAQFSLSLYRSMRRPKASTKSLDVKPKTDASTLTAVDSGALENIEIIDLQVNSPFFSMFIYF